MKNTNQKRRRLVNWWVRWEDLNWPSPDTLDQIRRRAERVAEANATTAILFGAHFRWDYLPYFTLLHDYIGTVAEELHARGVELFDRHSVNLIHRYDTREEMRHVMLHSGPHLPFSPSREAAASWEYKGRRLNDWRMTDVRDGSVLYYPQYAAEGFCYRNPDYLEAYCDYARTLLADTGIDGLSAEDPAHYMGYASCGCPHCRAELRRRAGIDLPPITDRSFWGNWDNPAWRQWIELRHDAETDFYKKLRASLPADFPLTGCGGNSASPESNFAGRNARNELPYVSYVNQEMCGNTPPYKHDPVTVNLPMQSRLINSSHHMAAAREHGVRAFSTGYGFTEPSANIIWAVNKLQDLDCLFSTLKARLGLADHILRTLPEEADAIGRAFTFEAEHPDLFAAEQIPQMGVYFSSETHRSTFFGNTDKGYYLDYSAALTLMLQAGISAHTVFAFPADTSLYPVILVPSAAAMTDAEIAALRAYLAAGGRVIACGPCAVPECVSSWNLPSHPEIDSPEDFFDTVRDGVWRQAAAWIRLTEMPACTDADRWEEVCPGLLYNPHRISEERVKPFVRELCCQNAPALPIEVLNARGYMITMFRRSDAILVHLLAEDYDADIDHHLDEIRFHRSRVNFINKVTPVGVSRTVEISAAGAPTVYTPFSDAPSAIECMRGTYLITLPENTAYAILEFPL